MKSLEVKSISVFDASGNKIEKIKVVPLGDRIYEIAEFIFIEVKTNKGVYRYRVNAGFKTNFRSGGLFVDRFVDQIGNTIEVQVSWIIHDIAYTPFHAFGFGACVLSRNEADELLRACLMFAGMGKAKSYIVWLSVRLFGFPAYDNDDEFTIENSYLFSFEKVYVWI